MNAVLLDLRYKLVKLIPQCLIVFFEADAYLFDIDGTLLRRRLGLSQLSLDRLDSYEGLERSMRMDILYERICDLKIRLAELNYSLGLPARIGELESELALRDEQLLRELPAQDVSGRRTVLPA